MNEKRITATQKAAALASSAVALAAISQPSEAGIVIANGVPSEVVPDDSGNVFWDVDGGGQHDFILFTNTSTVSSFTHGYLGSKSLGGRGFVHSGTSLASTNNIQNIRVGATIGSDLGGGGYYFGFSNSENRRMTSFGTAVGRDFDGGVFNSDQNYIGFRFDIGGNLHYGWAQINLASQQIVAAAYNDTPNGAIQVGQIPEPSSMALLGLGVAGLGILRRRVERRL